MRNPRRLRLDDQLCFALYAATNAVTRAYRPLLAELNMTYPQYLVMLVLWQDGPSLIWQIAERLHLGPNAITPLIDQLEQTGLVSRKRDNMDRRRVHVVLTESGLRLEHSAALAQGEVACRTGLSESELAELREELHALTDRVAPHSGNPMGPPSAGTRSKARPNAPYDRH